MTNPAIPSAAQVSLQVQGEVQELVDGNASSFDKPIVLREARLTESSGLACSNRRPECIWTHNDSGGVAELFAFDRRGDQAGKLIFPSIGQPIDWEDISSYVDEGVPRILIADCGDNLANRPSIALYLVDEPEFAGPIDQKSVQTLRVTYPDGPRDCEAVAVDIRRRLVVMFTKSVLPVCGVYVFPLPTKHDPMSMNIGATRIATLNVPMVTGADFDPRSGDLWLVNYFQAFRYSGMPATTRFSRQLTILPNAFDLPRLKQIEAVAVDHDGVVWVTSEGSPARIQRISVD